jgi:putative transposase
VRDGALGFWKAVRDVFPDTQEQRCWFHRIANVPAALPKSAHPGAKKALAEIWQAENKKLAVAAAKAFAADYGVKWPKAAAKITDDLDVLLAFYDYPAGHWVHLRITLYLVSSQRVFDVRHGTSRSVGLPWGRSYLQSSRRQSLWRDDASCASHLTGLVA